MVTPQSTSIPAVALPPPTDREALLRAAAAVIGLDAEAQSQFARFGQVRLGDITFALHASDVPQAPLTSVASASLLRPEGVAPSVWHDTLLAANEATMLTAEWSFTLEEDDSASLIMKLQPDMDTPVLLRAIFEAMMDLCATVRDAAARSNLNPEPLQ